jgi:8-oxo-dGTP pyrophosphatase MutT (NUDIX family)
MRADGNLAMPAAGTALEREFLAYGQRFPDEAGTTAAFAALLRDPADPFVRGRLDGHFTASAWLVDRGGTRLLMTHHRKLGLWLQLGGHADGDRDLARVALREAEEESGLAGLSVVPEIFDLDRHWIPEHKGVPDHWHYDVRYVVRTGASEAFAVEDAVDLRNVLMVEGGERPGFALEAIQPLRIGGDEAPRRRAWVVRAVAAFGCQSRLFCFSHGNSLF